MSAHLFPGFEAEDITTSGAVIHTVRGGSGPPALLLHGYPQTHAMWHNVAPRLAGQFTVVLTDLRGYGVSMEEPPQRLMRLCAALLHSGS